jgi:hypothetical protein
MKLAKRTKILHSELLSPAQLNAVELLSQGFNDTETAKAVKVSRQTIHAWRTGNAPFKEALGNARESLWQESRNQLRSLTLKAIGTLRQAIDGGSVLASVAVLRHALAIMPQEPEANKTEVLVRWETREKCYAGEVLELMELRKKYKPEIDFESMSHVELEEYSRNFEEQARGEHER